MAKKVQEPEVDVDELKLESLSGDLRDAMLMRVRQMKRPWSMLTEDEQRDLASGLEMAANHLVRRTVALLTDFEWPRAAVVLGEVKIKGEKGIEAKIGCANIEHNRSILGEHVGQHVLMLMVDSETFMGEREPVEIDPDQPDLPTGEQDEAA